MDYFDLIHYFTSSVSNYLYSSTSFLWFAIYFCYFRRYYILLFSTPFMFCHYDLSKNVYSFDDLLLSQNLPIHFHIKRVIQIFIFTSNICVSCLQYCWNRIMCMPSRPSSSSNPLKVDVSCISNPM